MQLAITPAWIISLENHQDVIFLVRFLVFACNSRPNFIAAFSPFGGFEVFRGLVEALSALISFFSFRFVERSHVLIVFKAGAGETISSETLFGSDDTQVHQASASSRAFEAPDALSFVIDDGAGAAARGPARSTASAGAQTRFRRHSTGNMGTPSSSIMLIDDDGRDEEDDEDDEMDLGGAGDDDEDEEDDDEDDADQAMVDQFGRHRSCAAVLQGSVHANAGGYHHFELLGTLKEPADFQTIDVVIEILTFCCLV